MTDTVFTRTALTEAAETAGVTTDQARTILEAAGVTVQPEKPALPTEPGSVIIATEVRGVKGRWRMFLDQDGEWYASPKIEGRRWHRPGHITAWIETVVLPVTTTPVTLTEDQVGEVWNANKVPHLNRWTATLGSLRGSITATVNAALAQYAAPTESEPIDPADVCEGDRVRVELRNGDEATFTVTRVAPDVLASACNGFYACTIRTIHLLHREEA